MRTERLRVALRVLAQCNDHTDPVRMDVELLQEWVRPEERTAPVDELACIVISTELKRRNRDHLVNDDASDGRDNGLSNAHH